MVIASITGLLGDKSSGQLGNIGDQAVDRVGASKDLVNGTNNRTKTNKKQTKTNKSFLEETMEVVSIKKADDIICCICSLKINFHSILIHEHHSYKSGVL